MLKPDKPTVYFDPNGNALSNADEDKRNSNSLGVQYVLKSDYEELEKYTEHLEQWLKNIMRPLDLPK